MNAQYSFKSDVMISFFLQLECNYWSLRAEEPLRHSMASITRTIRMRKLRNLLTLFKKGSVKMSDFIRYGYPKLSWEWRDARFWPPPVQC